jgi:hypothetical protein
MALHAAPRLILDTTNLSNVSGVRFARREQTVSLAGSGNLHQASHHILRAAPTLGFQTGDLAGLLGKLTNAEAPMWAIAGAGLIAHWAKQLTTAPGLVAGSKVTIAAGQVYLDELSWSWGDLARASCTALAVSSDGITDPAPVATGIVPAQQGTAEAYVLTSLTVGGTAIPEPQAFRLRIDHRADTNVAGAFSAGLPYPTKVVTAGANGALAISGEATFADVGLGVTIAGAGAVVAVFTRTVPDGFGLSANTVTVTLNATSLLMSGDLDGSEPSTRTLRFMASHDGTNRPMTVAVV